ncbi:MAG: hypothetical protein EB084_22910, partial [Proteobacteria bacterium]|nr:hypothetical protein [Pseudomonadota bacterium]
EQIVENATLPIARLRLTTDADIAALHQLGNNRQTNNEATLSHVVEAIEEQAALHPHAVALLFEDRTLSYGALNARADSLARHVVALGIGPDDRVAIVMDRGFDLIVAILATLKGGGAYVPLDPAWPTDRIAYALSDCRAKVVLTQHEHQQHVQQAVAGSQCQALPILALDDLFLQATSQHSTTAPLATPLTDQSLAYVIYTSGSTGRPKGVAVSHGGLTTYVRWALRTYPSGGAGAVMHTSPSFDLTMTSLYLPLLRGESVQILPNDPSLESLGAHLTQAQPCGIIKLTPSHLDLIGYQLQDHRTPRSRHEPLRARHPSQSRPPRHAW